MRILVMEHLTSAPGGQLPEALVSEGRAMRDAVVDDLLATRDVRIVLLGRREQAARCHRRIRQLEAGPDRDARFRSLVREADAVLVIAPEGDGLLAQLCRIVEKERRLLLGPSAAAVRLASDKWRLHRILRAARIATPGTVRLGHDTAAVALRRRRRPFVLKPRDGYGGLGVAIIRPGDRIRPALAAVAGATRRSDLLVQDFAPGEPASVSVVVGRDVDPDSIRALPLGLNRQRMTGLSRPVYTGGESGWPHPMATAAIRTAIEAVTALARAAPGCRGYLGVDLILGPSGPVVIEINPRITTAYIGIRRVVDRNLAGLILDACRARALPRAVSVSGRCRFDGGGAVKAIRDDGARTGEVRQCRSTAAGTSAASI